MVQLRQAETERGHESPVKVFESSGKLEATLRGIGRAARSAAHVLALAPAAQKNRALAAMARSVRRSGPGDPRRQCRGCGRSQIEIRLRIGHTRVFDRLTLDAKRVEAMAAGIDAIRKLKDPVGAVTSSWRRPNGLRIERVRCRWAWSA